MKPYIYPYLLGSHGASELAKALSTIQVRPNGKYRPRASHVVINWGNSVIPGWWGELASLRTVNKPQAVANATDKVRAFQLFSANSIPTLEWTISIDVARGWLSEAGAKVICRTLTRASEGRGIVIATTPEEVVFAPLYTKYKKKQFEYRIHAGKGRIFDMQMKRKRNGAPSGSLVRNAANGWVFCRQGIEVPQVCQNAAINAVQALGLDFGAVDVGFGTQGVAVYEVNTAPGLEGQTTTNYVNFFKGLLT